MSEGLAVFIAVVAGVVVGGVVSWFIIKVNKGG